MEIFPARKLELQMGEQGAEVEQSAKLFILTNTPNDQDAWFRPDWDLRKAIVVYDPRISVRDLDHDEE
jgi:hypothetical protein